MYYLFLIEDHYPSGGVGDFWKVFPTLGEAKKEFERLETSYVCHIAYIKEYEVRIVAGYRKSRSENEFHNRWIEGDEVREKYYIFRGSSS